MWIDFILLCICIDVLLKACSGSRLPLCTANKYIYACMHAQLCCMYKYSHFCSHYMQLETILETVDKMSHFHLAVVQVMRFVLAL